jgi:GAF domain-containing protein
VERTRRTCRGSNLDSDEQGDAETPPVDEAAAYVAISRLDLGARPLERTLHEIAALTQRAVREAAEVSVTLLGQEGPRTAASSGDLALRLDEQQYETGHGPCLDAALSVETNPVLVDDPAAPYPDFRRAAAADGVTRLLCVGIPAAGQVLGGINLYSSTGPFSARSTRMVRTFAGIAGLALATDHGGGVAPPAALVQQALASREVLDQAQGLLMVREGCSRGHAFLALVRLADEQGGSVRQAAQALVDRDA